MSSSESRRMEGRFHRDYSQRGNKISLRLSGKNFWNTTFIGLILFIGSAKAMSGISMDKAPLIATDNLLEKGFRHFYPGDVDIRSFTSRMINTPESLDFQAFKFIKKWGNDSNLLLIGGKNHVYMVDSRFSGDEELAYRELLTWHSDSRTHKECVMMPGQSEGLCENYIRFIELMADGELMVCGTNANAPACRYYRRDQFDQVIRGVDSKFTAESKCRDQCFVPNNPTKSSVSLYTNTEDGNKIFAAAINGFMANDPIIMKGHTLASNSAWLKEPTFLKMFEYHDKIYVIFREKSDSSEKEEFATIAQMCKNDPGGINVLPHQWTSFVKARLKCGFSDKQQFDNLTSVSDVISVTADSGRRLDVFYATFTTPLNWGDSSISAVCAFSMKAVIDVFEKGRFFNDEVYHLVPVSGTSGHGRNSSEPLQRVTKSYPIPDSQVPNPRPGSCNVSQSPNALYFAKAHLLIYEEIMPVSLSPIYLASGFRATQITADAKAGNHMVYIGSDSGKLLRLRSVFPEEKPKLILIEVMSLGSEEKCLRKDCSIRSFHVSRPIENGIELTPSLFVGFTDFVVQLATASCHVYVSEECCSVDLDCGWDGYQCVLRTAQNREDLVPASLTTTPLPENCRIAGMSAQCDCEQNKSAGCEEKPGEVRAESTLDDFNLKSLLEDSISSEMRRNFQKAVREMRKEGQRKSLKAQLKQAVSATVGLVLRNYDKEHCLPSLAVNYLTHVYPLVLREMELWHDAAVKKMEAEGFEEKCWRKDAKCTKRISFSVPLALTLWEPLTKLIVNFSGRCRLIETAEQGAGSRPRSSLCESLPGQIPCKDIRQPHCRAERCQFQGYAVDVKAFFRHANDSRYFLKSGVHPEPFWKAVPSNNSFRGHLEVVVSEDQPFLIDYSPVAEKVKLIFHYKPVRDCDVSSRGCTGSTRSCESEVEDIIGHWYKWVMRNLPRRMKKCSRQIMKIKKEKRRRRGDPETSYIDPSNSNTIEVGRERCRLVRGQVGELSSQPLTRNIWSLIGSRCQEAGCVRYGNKLMFYNLHELQAFFRNACSTEENRTLAQKSRRSESRSRLYVQPMVSHNVPFTIKWNNERVSFSFFAEQTT